MATPNRRDAFLRVLGEFAEPAEAKLARDRSTSDLFNDLDTAVIKRAWFQDLWAPDEWAAIVRFDASWRAAIGKYNRLPPWRQFWTSSAGRQISDEAAALLRMLAG